MTQVAPALKKATSKYVTAISEAELAIRILEATGQLKRPAGLTAEQALDNLDPENRAAWRRAAHAAMEYWRECIEAAQRPA